MLRFLIGIALMAIMISGCKVKDRNKERALPTQEKKNILWLLAGDHSKAWKVNTFNVNGEDMLKDMQPCQLDNIDVYFRNLVYESLEGNSRCKPDDPDIRARGKWSVNPDSTSIEVKIGTDFFSLRILEITENKLHYRSENDKQVTEVILEATDYKYPDNNN